MVLDYINNYIQKQKKLLVVLIDPDKLSKEKVKQLSIKANENKVGMFLVGGSMVNESVCDTIDVIKSASNKPVVLFPGNPTQLSAKADGLFLLSLLSGRNPDYLIGHHVNAAFSIKRLKLEAISVGYVLIDGGKTTSVEYVSNTRPIPSDKADLAAATAMAGEMLGNKLIYLEAGSGAHSPVPKTIINKVKQNISIPVIVGGGLRSAEDITTAFNAGADIVVVGNILEKDPNALTEMAKVL